MINLVKNELTKITKKKSFKILIFVLLVMIIISNCFYKYIYTEEDAVENEFSEINEEYVVNLKAQILGYQVFEAINTEEYVTAECNLQLAEYIMEFQNETWKAEMVSKYLYQPVLNIVSNTYLYENENKDEIIKENTEIRDEILTQLRNDNWRYFAEKELAEAQQDLKTAELNLSKSLDIEKQKHETNIHMNEVAIKVLEWRLEKDIPYQTSYKSNLLYNYIDEAYYVYSYENLLEEEQKDYFTKQNYYENLENIKTTEYIIENNINKTGENNAGSILANFYEENMFIIIVIAIIYSAVIVSEEFNKGTIKLLLVRPYSRVKILLSKFIALIIMVMFLTLLMMLMQFFVGGFILGFESLSVPVIRYDFNVSLVHEMNVFIYLLIETIYRIPLILILMAVAFTAGTLFTNASLATIFSLLVYLTYPFINTLVTIYQVKIMRYYITVNWSIEQYMFGNLPDIEGNTLQFSLIVWAVYFVALLGVAIVNFKKKNV